MKFPCIDLNCDIGENFGMWTIGDGVDAEIMSLISSANIACGFHAGDPDTMEKMVLLAKQHQVGIGAHPGFRDLQGFGRRHIVAQPEELVNDVLYQLGALREFVHWHDLRLQHIKLHGALYMHAANNEAFAESLVRRLFAIVPHSPLYCLANSALHRMAISLGYPTVREFYADRDYSTDGNIILTRRSKPLDPAQVANKVLRACQSGTVESVSGAVIDVAFDSVCIHSDTPGALELLTATRQLLEQHGIEIVALRKALPRPLS